MNIIRVDSYRRIYIELEILIVIFTYPCIHYRRRRKKKIKIFYIFPDVFYSVLIYCFIFFERRLSEASGDRQFNVYYWFFFYLDKIYIRFERSHVMSCISILLPIKTASKRDKTRFVRCKPLC